MLRIDGSPHPKSHRLKFSRQFKNSSSSSSCPYPMLPGVGATRFLLPCRPVIRHAITDSLLFHIILHTIHPSFLWPPSSSPSIHIYIHNFFGHMRLIPPLHTYIMPIPSQTVPFQLFCHWRYFQTSSNILIPYLIRQFKY